MLSVVIIRNTSNYATELPSTEEIIRLTINDHFSEPSFLLKTLFVSKICILYKTAIRNFLKYYNIPRKLRKTIIIVSQEIFPSVIPLAINCRNNSYLLTNQLH